MRTLAIGTLIAFALTGCGSDKDSDSGTSPATGTTTGNTTTGTGTTTGTTTGGTFAVTVDWTDDGSDPTDTDGNGFPDTGCGDDVNIVISDPLGMTAWDFGMAEDGANGWVGEDCLGGMAGFDICHPIGINHTLDEVTNCSANAVTAGTSTLLDAKKDPFLTYFLDDGGGACFVFGTDPAYYAGLGCTEMM